MLRDYGRNVPKVQTNIHVKPQSSRKIDFIIYATKYLISRAIQTHTLFSQICTAALASLWRSANRNSVYYCTLSQYHHSWEKPLRATAKNTGGIQPPSTHVSWPHFQSPAEFSPAHPCSHRNPVSDSAPMLKTPGTWIRGTWKSFLWSPLPLNYNHHSEEKAIISQVSGPQEPKAATQRLQFHWGHQNLQRSPSRSFQEAQLNLEGGRAAENVGPVPGLAPASSESPLPLHSTTPSTASATKAVLKAEMLLWSSKDEGEYT